MTKSHLSQYKLYNPWARYTSKFAFQFLRKPSYNAYKLNLMLQTNPEVMHKPFNDMHTDIFCYIVNLQGHLLHNNENGKALQQKI